MALLALRNEPMTDRFATEFESEPESLASMRGLLRRWLRHANADEEETAEIVTACGEAATNAVEHAGAGSEVPFEVAGALEGRPGRPHRARPRGVAVAQAGGSGAGALADARAHGYGGGRSRARWDQGAAATRAEGRGESRWLSVW